MHAQALRSIIYGQACLYGGLLLAVLLKPQGLAANSGISYYGIFARTILPYLFTLLGAAYFTWQCAQRISEPALKPVRTALLCAALCTAIIGVTPYTISSLVDQLHVAAGAILYSVQLLLSIWLIAKLHYVFWAVLLTAIEFCAGVACAMYLTPKQGLLIQCEMLFQIAFCILLFLSLRQLQGSSLMNAHA